jgi:hypothetical protein
MRERAHRRPRAIACRWSASDDTRQPSADDREGVCEPARPERTTQVKEIDDEGRKQWVTRYDYATTWMQSWQDFTSFRGPDAPRNPAMPLLTEQWLAG